ncbi:helicase RepA family protein [Aliiroseovarius crassostreae]|uniref:AAA family ATPase n=1 Tax=Aliiroseovarius crassostreae TaxID=154981 RepID=UPI0022017DF6|nr:helicase RepA family protein [Aliiroseovarius crassostreae]UWQ02845.1 helicase RepA family protein [Aliiroseovarius crassostreae]
MQTRLQPKSEFIFERANDHIPSRECNYVIRDLCNRKEVGLLVAPSNVGKTAVAVALGAHVVQGKPVLRMNTKRGAVLHICGEGGDGVKDRVYALLREVEDAEDYLVMKSRLNLGDPDHVPELIEQLKKHLPHCETAISLIIIDTFIHAIADLNENFSNEMSIATSGAQTIAEELDAHVLLVHHTGRDEDKGGRGSSAIRTNVDSEFTIKKDEDSGTCVVNTTKQRNMAGDLRFSYELEKVKLCTDKEGFDRFTVKATLLDGSLSTDDVAPAKFSPLQAAVWTALKGIQAQGKTGSVTSKIFDAIPYELRPKNSNSASNGTALRGALAKLEEAGKVNGVKHGREKFWTLYDPHLHCADK